MTWAPANLQSGKQGASAGARLEVTAAPRPRFLAGSMLSPPPKLAVRPLSAAVAGALSRALSWLAAGCGLASGTAATPYAPP